jgi:hypothetical protein
MIVACDNISNRTSIHEIDQLLQISSWMASKHSTFSSLSWKDILENNDIKTLEESYTFFLFWVFL